MNSLPTIEGLTYTSSDVQTLYNKVVSDMEDFFSSYQSYIQCSSKKPTIPCSNDDVQSKLNTVNRSLAKFNDVVSKNDNKKNTIQLEADLKRLRGIVDEKTKMLTDSKNSINRDYIIKQESNYYYNLVVSIFLACAIYYVFTILDKKRISP